jgi:hypothetical protein
MGGYYQPSIALTRQMIVRGFNPVEAGLTRADTIDTALVFFASVRT